jgi:ABC-2 type transport system ATP-binding protein
MERICDRVLILRKGQLVAQGTMRDIRAVTQGTEVVACVSVPLVGTVPAERGFERTLPDLESVKELEREAVTAGGRLVDVRTKELSLEEIFLRTTKS